MKKNVLDYELTEEEQLLVQVIRYAVASDKEMAEAFNKAVSPLLIYANFTEKAADLRREINFPELLELTERAVEKCCDEVAQLNSVQEMPMPEIECGVEMLRKMNVKRVLQTAEYEFYDALVRLCKNKKF